MTKLKVIAGGLGDPEFDPDGIKAELAREFELLTDLPGIQQECAVLMDCDKRPQTSTQSIVDSLLAIAAKHPEIPASHVAWILRCSMGEHCLRSPTPLPSPPKSIRPR